MDSRSVSTTFNTIGGRATQVHPTAESRPALAGVYNHPPLNPLPSREGKPHDAILTCRIFFEDKLVVPYETINFD